VVSDLHPSKNWIIAALVFNAISTAGTFSLAYMMMSKYLPQHLYLGSVYFYLHFQYNGWFFFSCMGLFLAYLHRKLPEVLIPKPIFTLLVWSCIPAFFLSTLWAKLPTWLYVLVVAGALGQFIGWFIFLNFLYKNRGKLKAIFAPSVRILSVLLVLTISIKFLLQLGSTIPEISKFAFGFRSIVIAYLHLVLLGIITIFLITYALAMNFIQLNHRNAYFGLAVFTGFVFLIEIILAIQGIASFTYTLIPYSNELLLICSVALFAGLIVLYKSQDRLTKR
jgi:hypothetical protein